MKRVEYKKLSVKNFLSIGRDPVVVEFTKGIHIITGVNKDKTDRKNGVGKSSIACAFYFAHFGEAIRDIKKDLIINDVTNETVEVILEVDVIENGIKDKYIIERNLKPSKLTVTKNGKDVTLSTIPVTTNYICAVLGVTPSLMTNCIVMTLNDTTPFMAKPKGDKRKFIEDVFDLDVFSRMVTELKKDYKEVKRDVELKETSVNEIKQTVTILKEQKDKLEQIKQERLDLYIKRRDENIRERDLLTEKISKYTSLDVNDLDERINKCIEASDKLSKTATQAQCVIYEAEAEIRSLQNDKSKLLKSIEQGMCHECKREVTQHDTEHYDKHITTIDRDIDTLKVKIDKHKIIEAEIKTKRQKLLNAASSFSTRKHEYISIKEERKAEIKRLEQLNEWLKELNKDIDNVEKSNDDFIANIKKEATRLKDNITQLNKIREQFKVLESAKFVLGDEGVKTHIIKKLIDLLNKKLVHYIRKLDGNCICKFNEYFEEEIINTKKKIRSYFNFSGAEKKAVDLACLFTFSDIKRMQGGVSYNVSIYDELFDTSLDETGVNLVIDILNERVEHNNECVLIISHRKEAIKAVTGDIIYLEKSNDITRRVAYDGVDGK
jgi:DNA repair exonuclease SbcCD ATPase subunit